MLTPYRGRVEITCRETNCKTDKAKSNVDRACFECDLSMVNMLDLEEKPIGQIKKKITKRGGK